jgi:hypothetical protein
MPNGRHLWSVLPWLMSAVLALAYVHQGVQLRQAQRETEQLRQRLSVSLREGATLSPGAGHGEPG